MTLKQLTEKRGKLVAQASELQKKAKDENRDLTDEEKRSVDGWLDEVDDIDNNQIPAAKKQADEERSARLQRFEQHLNSPATPPPRGAEPATEDRSDPVDNPESEQYSMLRAVRCILDHKPVDGYEGEISQEIAHRAGKSPQGFYMPHTLSVRSLHGARRTEYRDVDTTAAAGAIPDNYMGSRFVDLLRNRVRVVRAGATLLTGLQGQGQVEIPKQTGAGQTYWVGEGGSPTESAQSIGQITITPTTQGAFTDLTRRAINQTGMDMEMFVRNDLLTVMGIGLDTAALNGSGASNQPTGILQNGSIDTVAIGTNGGALTRDHVLQLERDVSVDNADDATLNFMTNPKVRKNLKETTLDAGSGRFIWGPDNTVEGYGTMVTNQMPSNLTKGSGTNLSSMIYGDWSTVLLAFWSGMDVMIDPYSLSTSGGVRVIVLQDLQVSIRHTEALKKIVDIDTT